MDESQPVGRDDKEPLSKKLRCSEPDLKIVVKYTDDNEEEFTKEYQMHSVLMANLSQFIDTALSVEMRENSTKQITMHVESLDIFEKALKFQHDFSAVRSMTTQDAVDLVEFYDKYSFAGGLKLCDDILSDFLQKPICNATPPNNFDLLVDAAVVAFQFNLPKSKDRGITRLTSRLLDETSSYGRMMFGVEHIRKLHPLFKGGHFSYTYDDDVTEEELESPLFPKWFVEKSANLFGSFLHEVLVVSGTQTKVDGIFHYDYDSELYYQPLDGATTWNGQETEFWVLKNSDGEWSIMREGFETDPGSVVLWKCPVSGHLPLPPVGPWIAVDKVAKKTGTTPKISYKSDADGV